jgi:hypothetical protein
VVVADVPGVGLMSFESWSMICVIVSLLALNCLLLGFPFYEKGRPGAVGEC